MKILLLSVLTFSALSAAAMASNMDDVKNLAAKASVSDSCATKILSQATRQCNADSAAQEGEDRMHECFYNYDITQKNDGIVSIGFTTGDADEWYYSVSFKAASSADSCDFVIQSQN